MRISSLSLCSLSLSLLLALPAHASLMYTSAKQAYVMDDETGTVLLNKDGDQEMIPSSMTKLMTLYLIFDQIEKGKIHLDDMFPVSEKAWKIQGSKMFVGYNTMVKVEDLIRGIAIQSGNDACVVMAEAIAGDESAFANLMNIKAQQLGMTSSHFLNSNGWPEEGHVVSAHDLATLAHHIIHDFPQYYHYFSEPDFTYNGIHQYNRNLLLGRQMGADGLKTGHTEAGGYGMVASAKEGDRRVIVVVNGMESDKERATEAERLLRHVFRNFANVELLKAGTPIAEVPVWFGAKDTAQLIVKDKVRVLFPSLWEGQTTVTLVYDSPVPAPINVGDVVAHLRIQPPQMDAVMVPLTVSESVEKASFVSHVIKAIAYHLGGSGGGGTVVADVPEQQPAVAAPASAPAEAASVESSEPAVTEPSAPAVTDPSESAVTEPSAPVEEPAGSEDGEAAEKEGAPTE
jgi:D-alanyl-D-alanine carboxypeptidase (penicillin-binding protein 5/6)